MYLLERILPYMDERFVNERYNGALPDDHDEMDYVTFEDRLVIIA